MSASPPFQPPSPIPCSLFAIRQDNLQNLLWCPIDAPPHVTYSLGDNLFIICSGADRDVSAARSGTMLIPADGLCNSGSRGHRHGVISRPAPALVQSFASLPTRRTQWEQPDAPYLLPPKLTFFATFFPFSFFPLSSPLTMGWPVWGSMEI